jgi:hypothetical protein
MRLDIFKKFITQEEADELNSFTLNAIKQGKFKDGTTSKHLNPSGSHLVSRSSNDLVLPKLAFTVKNRIMQQFGLLEKDTFRRFSSHGIVVNCSFKNAQLAKHKDLSIGDNQSLLRCNVITSQPNKGGLLFVEDTLVDTKDTDMYTCLVSEHEHYSTINEDEKPRIVWQFGFNIDKNIWEKN